MYQKTKKLSIFLILLSISLGVVFYTLHIKYTQKNIDKKKIFVSITKLPDISISTESIYIRHRTLSDIFHIYKDDPSLSPYSPSTFSISHSNIDKNIYIIKGKI
jgi:hypothetical protein